MTVNESGSDYLNQQKEVQIPSRELPILFDVDVAIVGGSFAAVSAALKLADAGKQVAIIESRTYLGREVTATLRPWLDASRPFNFNELPEVLQAVASRGTKRDGEIALYMDHVKTTLENLLLNKDIKLLYASSATGFYTDENGRKMVVTGNKSGRQVIKSDIVIDATESASVLKLAGEQFEQADASWYSFWKTIELYRAEEIIGKEVKLPEEVGIENNTAYVHQGYAENGHVFLEFKLKMDKSDKETVSEQVMDYEVASRHTMMRLAEYLLQEHKACQNAYLAASSYELQSEQIPRLKLDLSETSAQKMNHGARLDGFASTDQRLWCLNEAARLEDAGLLFANPITSSQLGIELAELLISKWEDFMRFCGEPSQQKLPDKAEVKYRISELEQPQQGRQYQKHMVPGQGVPIVHQTEVLVVGGGTSGATAAITSAKEGMETLLLEMNPGLGGTGTLGAVDSYWFGRRVGFNRFVTEKVNEVQKKINHHSPKWNIEAKMYALLKEAEKAGVQTYFNTKIIGTIMEENRVRGVVAVNAYGPFAVMADAVIDATGDGDVAAFAGAEYIYGSERDHIVMWYSLAQFAKPGRSQNNFTSMVDISNVEDYTRAILDGRRRKRKRDVHDHGIYVASRETRHVLGEEVLTLTDQLRYRQWDDVINIHFSNHDMKGKNGADWMHLGLIPPNLEIEIPYQILLPKGLEGILIAGKAVSATHDAFAAIRMQSDLENLGGVTAIAAAQAVRTRQLPRDIDIRALQKRLIKEELLPEAVLSRTVETKQYEGHELEALVESLTGEEPLYMYADMEMDEVFTERIPIVEVCTAGPAIIPYLEKGLDKALENGDTNRQVVLAQSLAMYESSYGYGVLEREIERELSKDYLPVRDNIIRHTQLPPDQGAMPDVVYLIYTIGMTRDKRSLSIWEKVADRIRPTEDNLKDMLKGTFYYVDAVCYGAERLADPDCIPILEKLYQHDNLKSQLRSSGVEPDYFKERQAMLDLSIARALARCGGKEGYQVLIDYLEDSRALLAEQAHTELKRLTEKDFQKNKRQWLSYLEAIAHNLEPRPLTLKLDIKDDVTANFI
ncbi:FAD-dependent oxidoreductase [Sediminibacillus massiliensis]|uniref:FAD-dependent oxidoreductase n=1 Tax=Sediminibacillus massiliensis TaxID=1926277 RepID=UPI0009883FB1|nr:FAD-dependent oxidoreductase [Sediminibacillus massiliensis]